MSFLHMLARRLWSDFIVGAAATGLVWIGPPWVRCIGAGMVAVTILHAFCKGYSGHAEDASSAQGRP